MARGRSTFSVLCIHGLGHERDRELASRWTTAITAGIHRWNSTLDLRFEFLACGDLWDRAPGDSERYRQALARLVASGFIHGISDEVGGATVLFDVPASVRVAADRLARWASDDHLRRQLRSRVLDAMSTVRWRLVCAHGVASLGCYDALRRRPGRATHCRIVTFGSPIGSPFVRGCLCGRIEPLGVAAWYHLHNPHDRALSTPIRLSAPGFVPVLTDFDRTGDTLQQDPVSYLAHPATDTRVWLDIAKPRRLRSYHRQVHAISTVTPRPRRLALLVGINRYPDTAHRLEGCGNDVFLMSAVLQECGFEPEGIRVVLDDRATTANILDRLRWLIDEVPEGGVRLFFYAGHGAQIPAYAPYTEADHLDECLVPYDFDWTKAHAISDDRFADLYGQLPYGCRFVAIFDCCHSGGLARERRLPRRLEPPDDIRHRALQWNAERRLWQVRAGVNRPVIKMRLGRGTGLRGLAPEVYERERRRLRHRGPYLPVILEACQERELAYEHRDGTSSFGAFTFALARVLRAAGRGRPISFQAIARRTAAHLAALGYDQTPNLIGPRDILRRRVPWLHPMKGVIS